MNNKIIQGLMSLYPYSCSLIRKKSFLAHKPYRLTS